MRGKLGDEGGEWHYLVNQPGLAWLGFDNIPTLRLGPTMYLETPSENEQKWAQGEVTALFKSVLAVFGELCKLVEMDKMQISHPYGLQMKF